MASHSLRARQFVGRPIEQVFDFFAEPRNLSRITPSGMGFEFLTFDFEMREGLEIEYRLRPLFGVPAKWRTRITDGRNTNESGRESPASRFFTSVSCRFCRVWTLTAT